MFDLDRPLAILDLEATGADPTEARIIQVAVRVRRPGDKPTVDYSQIVDPGVPIPEHVQTLTGITSAVVEERGQPWSEVAPQLDPLLEAADLAGYNILAYDWPLLKAEYERIGRSIPRLKSRRIIDAYRLEQALRPRTLSAVYRRRTGKSLGNDAHDAGADVGATDAVLQDQIGEAGRTGLEALDQLQRGGYIDAGRKLRRIDGRAVLQFGKHQGRSLSWLERNDPGYLDWMRREIDGLRPHIDEELD